MKELYLAGKIAELLAAFEGMKALKKLLPDVLKPAVSWK